MTTHTQLDHHKTKQTGSEFCSMPICVITSKADGFITSNKIHYMFTLVSFAVCGWRNSTVGLNLANTHTHTHIHTHTLYCTVLLSYLPTTNCIAKRRSPSVEPGDEATRRIIFNSVTIAGWGS